MNCSNGDDCVTQPSCPSMGSSWGAWSWILRLFCYTESSQFRKVGEVGSRAHGFLMLQLQYIPRQSPQDAGKLFHIPGP